MKQVRQYSTERGCSRGWAWLVEHRDHRGEDCLIWPFSVTHKGYGNFGHNGEMYRAHRVMCEFRHGPPPTPRHHAAHNCNNRRCCNPNHIEWKTALENNLDRKKHGTNGTGRGPCSLTPEQVIEIRALKGTASSRDIAPRYGVSANSIDNVWGGKTYAGPHMRRRRKPLPELV